MIAQTFISYYGLNYVEHAEAYFKEMKVHRDCFKNFCTMNAR